MATQKIEYLKNENLITIKEEFRGVPFSFGRFIGEFESRKGHNYSKSSSLYHYFKKTLNKNINEIIEPPMQIIKESNFHNEKEDFLIWLGHASFFLQINQKKILIDPCFYNIPLKKRYTPPPYDIMELGHIDYLLISHGHHDHLDLKAIKKAGAKISKALTPLNMEPLIRRNNHHIKVEEAGWYQQYNTEEIEIFFLPAHHWHRRTAFDINRVLWGSFIIRDENKTIFFCGDSGYNTHFKEIKNLFGDIDYALMPVNPPYVFEGSHMHDEQLAQAVKDLDPKVVLPMHYGTFKFTTVPWKKLLDNFHNHIHTQKLIPIMGKYYKL